MAHISLDDIKQAVERLADKIGAPENQLPTYGYTRDGAYPHIESTVTGLHFVVVERGEELKRQTTKDLDELLYWIFESITFSMSVEFELRHRLHAQDFRRIMFKKQEELLGILNSGWQHKQQEEHKKILEQHPFVDS